MTKQYVDDLCYEVLGCAIDVHRELGPGLLESAYKYCLQYELTKKHLSWQSEIRVPLIYDNTNLDIDLRLDILVEDLIVVELKAIERILPVHMAQLLTYMKLTERPKGLILNFNCANIFREGQKTLVNEFYANLPNK
ncbi:MAG: GxxExxY protein [Chitinophagaceae bacterium]|nr:GxxExxY protein [Chitinophagaceae bacterium]MBL0335990.1 GxxExxY protein [Chitinophagaceae bacterium]